VKKKCSGDRIAQHKRSIRKTANPHYGQEYPWESSYAGQNTTDEFIVTEVYIETGSVCIDCRKERCGQYQEEIEVRGID
jgi:hypothetical protein